MNRQQRRAEQSKQRKNPSATTSHFPARLALPAKPRTKMAFLSPNEQEGNMLLAEIAKTPAFILWFRPDPNRFNKPEFPWIPVGLYKNLDELEAAQKFHEKSIYAFNESLHEYINDRLPEDNTDWFAWDDTLEYAFTEAWRDMNHPTCLSQYRYLDASEYCWGVYGVMEKFSFYYGDHREVDSSYRVCWIDHRAESLSPRLS